MKEYTVDVLLTGTLHVKADTVEELKQALDDLQGANPDLALTPTIQLTELSVGNNLAHEVIVVSAEEDGEEVTAESGLILSDFEEPHACDHCGTVYDETSGDGYAGLCPTCADAGIEAKR